MVSTQVVQILQNLSVAILAIGYAFFLSAPSPTSPAEKWRKQQG